MMFLVSGLLASPCAAPALPAQALTLGIEVHGHTLAGTAIVAAEGGTWSLTLLSPGGLGLFTLSGPPQVVQTGLDSWRPWLEKLPVERDLMLAFTPVPPEGCTIGTGKIRVDRQGGRHWRGPGGPAHLQQEANTLTLVDRLRGYTLLLVVLPQEDPSLAP